MRKLAPSLLLLAACATTTPPQKLPCEDGDAARCLQFVKFVESTTQRDGVLSQKLERYCLEGSLESCQRLAKVRRDSSLDRLCQDGISEACPIPNDKRAAEVLNAECEQGLPDACRVSFAKSGFDKASRAALDRGCTEGIAQACFRVSRVLSAEPERAKQLAWRSCLAGVEEACLASDGGATRCAQGNEPACRAFMLVRTDTDETRTRKLGVLKQACAHKVAKACAGLITVVPRNELLTLACGDLAPCRVVVESFDDEVLHELCRNGKDLVRDLSCGLLVGAYRLRRDEIPPLVREWSKSYCEQAPKANRQARCEQWSYVLEDSGQRIDAIRLQCTYMECGAKDSLQLLDRCLGGEKGDACARTGVWLRELLPQRGQDLATYRKVLTLACESNEAMSCLAGASLDPNPITRLELYEIACRAGSKEGCLVGGQLSLAKRECERGTCGNWAHEFHVGRQMTAEGGALLEATCARGNKSDCDEWADFASATMRVRKCVQNESFCPPFLRPAKGEVEFMKALRPKLTAELKRCDAGDGKGCAELISLTLNTGYFSPRMSDDDSLKWASASCDAGMSCSQLLSELNAQPRTPELEQREQSARSKACVRGEARHCGEFARALWERRSRKKEGLLSDEFKQALAMALRGCELKDMRSCQLAADFVESGVGVAADPLEAERLRSKARETLME